MANKRAKSKPVQGRRIRLRGKSRKANSTAAPGPGPNYSPRATRSISALTRRSTMTGRLSSSKDLSIGRSISRVRPTTTSLCWTNRLARRALKAARTEPSVGLKRKRGPPPRAKLALGERVVVRDDSSDRGKNFFHRGLMRPWLRRRIVFQEGIGCAHDSLTPSKARCAHP